MNVLFFKPIPRYALWGGDLVKDYFGYDDFSVKVGQAWAFSGQPGASNICVTKPYDGMTLEQLWTTHQELFGGHKGEFPLIISLVAPAADLSIQVHPDAKYSQKIGYPQGKNEAWYFIEAQPGADIVYGHQAKNRNDIERYLKNNQWDALISHLPVKTGDFVYLPAGMLHALRNGSIVYEIQQATDITYRFYDYGRLDEKGQPRQLHLQDALNCLSYDQEAMKNPLAPIVTKKEGWIKTVFIDNDSFTVTKLELKGELEYHSPQYQLATVVVGAGKVDDTAIKTGANFLIPANEKVVLNGDMVIMMTSA